MDHFVLLLIVQIALFIVRPWSNFPWLVTLLPTLIMGAGVWVAMVFMMVITAFV